MYSSPVAHKRNHDPDTIGTSKNLKHQSNSGKEISHKDKPNPTIIILPKTCTNKIHNKIIELQIDRIAKRKNITNQPSRKASSTHGTNNNEIRFKNKLHPSKWKGHKKSEMAQWGAAKKQ